jgi:hypothetical protein
MPTWYTIHMNTEPQHQPRSYPPSKWPSAGHATGLASPLIRTTCKCPICNPFIFNSLQTARGCTPPRSFADRPFARICEMPPSKPFVFSTIRTLPSSVYRKSFVCHSYENRGGVPQFFPFWNSGPAPFSAGAASIPTSLPRCFVTSSSPRVPLRRTPPSATMASVLAKCQETTPPLPVSKKSERTSGPAIVPSRSRVQLQVVPGSIVPMMDRRAGWLAIQQRVGKAGSVRLG